MKKTALIMLTMLALFVHIAHAAQKRKVLFIGLDGVRSDALQLANTPVLDQLIANGFYTYDSWCLGITVSGPSWSTIFTGVWYQKHGVTDNSYAGSNYNNYPYFPKRAKEINPGIYAAQIVDWAPMSNQVYNDGYDQKIIRPGGNCAAIVAAAKIQLQNPSLDILNVYFNKVDGAGHGSGFSPSNPSYMATIEEVDGYVGQVIQALYERPTYNEEDWLILVTTDHGGQGTSHGGNSNDERHIWWIGSGKDVHTKMVIAQDPGSYKLSGVNQELLKKAPVQADIAVTALHHLIYDSGRRPEEITEWNLDGKSWLDSIKIPAQDDPEDPQDPEEPISVKDVPGNFEMNMYPNPSTGVVSFWFDPGDAAVAYQVTDMRGRVVRQATGIHMAGQYKLHIDLSDQPAGNYAVQVQAGTRVSVKKISLTK